MNKVSARNFFSPDIDLWHAEGLVRRAIVYEMFLDISKKVGYYKVNWQGKGGCTGEPAGDRLAEVPGHSRNDGDITVEGNSPTRRVGLCRFPGASAPFLAGTL